MCGIFAIATQQQDAATKTFDGLCRLEYRGYDSWGVALVNKDNKTIIHKEIGKISEGDYVGQPSSRAIGHSRWATHGRVTDINAHPHQVGQVTLAHNGIVENYLELKDALEKNGYSFVSETDTEILAAQFDYELGQTSNVHEAIQSLVSKLTGRYAFIALIEGEEGIWAVRNGSPLIVGVSKDAYYIASDIPAFLPYTDVVNYLDDGQYCHMCADKITFYNQSDRQEIPKNDIKVELSIEEAEKGDFEHYMVKEIYDQKLTLGKSLRQDQDLIDEFTLLMKEKSTIIITGCGTSHKVAMVGAYYFLKQQGRHVQVVPSSELVHHKDTFDNNTMLVAISQSGETADVLEIVDMVKESGGSVVAITNVISSTLAHRAELVFPIYAGVEKAVASTKAATSQMMILQLLSMAGSNSEQRLVGDALGLVGNLNENLNPHYIEHIEQVAKVIAKHDNLFIIGRGELYPIALEAAIKIQEVSYIHAQGFAAGELKHGPIALITEGSPCLVLGDDKEILSSAAELKARGAVIIGISKENQSAFDYWISVADTRLLLAVATLIPVQLLSYYLARERGLDPDMPRNLAKSVTVK